MRQENYIMKMYIQKNLLQMFWNAEKVKKDTRSFGPDSFYPEGGGQPCDLGTLDTVEVLDAGKDGEIIHYTKEAIEPGKEVTGKIDWD